MSRRNKRATITAETEEHFIRMTEWLAMESEAELERMAERRKARDSAQAEKSGETLLDLVIEDSDSGLGGRHLLTLVKRNREQRMPWHRLRVGSPVVMSTYPNEDGDSYQGVVSAKKNNSIQVALSRYPEGRQFRIDLSADEVTRRRLLAAINMVKESKGRLGHLRDIAMGETRPEFHTGNSGQGRGDGPIEFQTDLNPSQQSAVQFCLQADDVAIIHGPPGTGKTTTVVELIIQAVARGERVLACGPSNTSVDNLLERLADAGQRVVRLGHPARVTETLRKHTLDGIVEDSDEMSIIRAMLREAEEIFRRLDRYTRARPGRGERMEQKREAKRLKSDARLLEKQAIHNVLDRADVICATTTLNDDLLGDRWFDLCVIDEACQSTEPGCWIPLSRCDKFVLAGDHQQLPPTVLSQEAARAGFDISLLERMNKIYGDEITRLLSVQYRMHKQIMDFSSDHFYDGELVADESVADHLLSDLEFVEPSEFSQTTMTFIDTAGANWDEELEPEGLSKRNVKEAELILKKAEQLIEAGVKPDEIAIIAPYAAQVRLLRRKSTYNAIEVGTVDGFQGREKECVLISTVRSNPEGEIGFLGDARRMNVAITRARRKLIVVGDSATLGNNPFFKSLLDYFESVGGYCSVWEEQDYE